MEENISWYIIFHGKHYGQVITRIVLKYRRGLNYCCPRLVRRIRRPKTPPKSSLLKDHKLLDWSAYVLTPNTNYIAYLTTPTIDTLDTQNQTAHSSPTPILLS